MKFFASGADVDDNIGDVTEDGGKEHKTKNQLNYDKDEFAFGFRLEDATGGGECECAQVETLEVVADAVIACHPH